MGILYSLALAFLNRFPITYFVTKTMPINAIDLLSIDNCNISLLQMIRTCSTGYTGFIHVDALGVNTHMHTCITDKNNFKKPVKC